MPAKTRMIPGFDGESYAVDVYLAKHRPKNQELVGDGYPFNPVLRADFGNTANEYRETQEREDWWGLPYIETLSWEAREEHARKLQASHRAEGNEYVKTDAQFSAELAANRANFYEKFPEGVQYYVSCLDGGAWDRPTNWGTFASLELALECCEQGPSWRRGK